MRESIKRLNDRNLQRYYVLNLLISLLFSLVFYILSVDLSATYARSQDYYSVALLLGFILVTKAFWDVFFRSTKSLIVLLLISVYLSLSIGRLLLFGMDRLIGQNFVFGDINYVGSISIIGMAAILLMRNGFSFKETVYTLIIVSGSTISDFLIGMNATKMIISS